MQVDVGGQNALDKMGRKFYTSIIEGLILDISKIRYFDPSTCRSSIFRFDKLSDISIQWGARLKSSRLESFFWLGKEIVRIRANLLVLIH